jgi:serine/threonine-protein kinase HipA
MVSASVIEVIAWDKTVGAVAFDPNIGAYVFEYDPAWARGGIELAPLQMPTSTRSKRFSFPALPNSFKGLPGLLSDALPDDFGNALIDAWMATKGISKASITVLDRLAYMDRRGMGALEFRPPIKSANAGNIGLDMKDLVEAARRALKGDFAEDAHAQAALAQIIQVGTSAGGARAKAVIAWNPTTHEIRSGQFDVAPGFEHWLLKFDGVGKDMELGTSADYGRIEYAYYLMASAAGIMMSPCRLLEENGRAHFMTKRFDRNGNERHHVQSLCAMAHMDYKQHATHAYEQLFQVIDILGLGNAALDQAFRRMALNVISRNCDDHTKNHGFLLRKGGVWALSPAYDVTHAHNPKGEWTSQHLMSVNGRFDNIQENDLMTVADRFSVPKAQKALNDIRDAVSRWKDFSAVAGVSIKESKRVAADFRLLEIDPFEDR